ncbi:MAG TPA: pantoate--beta-alanine ligase [Thermoanaerobaculia bacterium]|jgi:pantoate--beta-alanine ligase|nr:pantoate--beta-alanine ligase [Thermoanaerobaculia bacterium]
MIIARTQDELRRTVDGWRAAGERIGFVPTMGALHAGHLSLVRLARGRVTKVVASVFVNPAQFGPSEDFNRYPRQPEKDGAMLEEAGCDLLFLPDVATIYPPGNATFVEPAGAAEGLEGACRPGHFRGVATVVCALFNLVRADVAVFGEKDAQQLAVIRQMVRDLHLSVEIVPGPTVRETDGLAMSSRNAYLSSEERRAAAVLHRSLRAAEAAIGEGERRGKAVRERLREILNTEPLARVEYAEVVDAESFQPVETLRGRLVLPLAVRIGGTRLIDNIRLTVGETRPPEESRI